MNETTGERLYRARYARSVAGCILIATTIGVVVLSGNSVIATMRDVAIESPIHSGPVVLLAGWMMAAVAVLSRRAWVPRVQDSAAASERLLSRSITLPMSGLALVFPMTIHGLVFLLSVADSDLLAVQFSAWITISVALVGLAHLTLVQRMVRDTRQMLTSGVSISWKLLAKNALKKTTLMACIPGIILFGIPPLLTLGTGLVFIPLMYWGATRLIAVERTCQDWFRLAERTGLSTSSSRPKVWLPSLSGTIDGCPVTLRGVRQLRCSIAFELEVGFFAPDLAHLQLTADPNLPGQLQTGDPVADAVLQITALDPGDAASLAERMRDPLGYAAVMAVVHGRGAVIHQEQITLRLTATTLAPIWEALPELIDLAQILNRPVASRALMPAQPVRQASPEG